MLLNFNIRHSILSTLITALCIQLADKLILEKISCPLGVLLVIFESRPDALVQVITYLFFLNLYLSYIFNTNIKDISMTKKKSSDIMSMIVLLNMLKLNIDSYNDS